MSCGQPKAGRKNANAALLHLCGTRSDRAAVAELLEQPDVDPDDLAALDDVWEESEVRFGPDPAAGCAQVGAQVSEVLVRMERPTAPASRHATD